MDPHPKFRLIPSLILLAALLLCSCQPFYQDVLPMDDKAVSFLGDDDRYLYITVRTDAYRVPKNFGSPAELVLKPKKLQLPSEATAIAPDIRPDGNLRIENGRMIYGATPLMDLSGYLSEYQRLKADHPEWKSSGPVPSLKKYQQQGGPLLLAVSTAIAPELSSARTPRANDLFLIQNNSAVKLDSPRDFELVTVVPYRDGSWMLFGGTRSSEGYDETALYRMKPDGTLQEYNSALGVNVIEYLGKINEQVVLYAETRAFSQNRKPDSKRYSNAKFGLYTMESAGYLKKAKLKVQPKPGDHPYLSSDGSIFAVTGNNTVLVNLTTGQSIPLKP